jgi:hypothetical protein
MKIGEAHRTSSSYLYSANTNGAPMHPAPIGMGGPNVKKKFLAHRVMSALPIGGGGHRCANILVDRCPPRHYYWETDGFTSPRVGQNKINKI